MLHCVSIHTNLYSLRMHLEYVAKPSFRYITMDARKGIFNCKWFIVNGIYDHNLARLINFLFREKQSKLKQKLFHAVCRKNCPVDIFLEYSDLLIQRAMYSEETVKQRLNG